MKNKHMKVDENTIGEKNKSRPASDFYKHDKYPKKRKEKKPGSDMSHRRGE